MNLFRVFRTFWILLVAVCFSLDSASIAQPAANDPATPPSEASLTVTGRGEIFARPDRAVVRVGVDVQAKEAVAAQTDANQRMQKILKDLKTLGIPDRFLATRSIELFPMTASVPESEAIEVRGYRATQIVEVTVDRVEMTGKVLDSAFKSGANRFEGVSFGLENDLPQRREALRLAVAEAAAKAETIVSALGGRLVSITEVSEEGSGVEQPMPMARGRIMAMADTAVQPGEARVTAGVRVVYSIIPGPQKGPSGAEPAASPKSQSQPR